MSLRSSDDAAGKGQSPSRGAGPWVLVAVAAAAATSLGIWAATQTASFGTNWRRVRPAPRYRVRNDSAYAAGRLYVAYGQSNSDCCGDLPADGRTAHDPRVVQHFAGDTYRMTQPMFGATCRGGCVWPRLGQRMVASANATEEEHHPIETVVFATCGVGGASLAQLSEGTEAFAFLMATLQNMRRVYGRAVDGVLYHQGESDNLHRVADASQRHAAQAAYAARLARLADAVHAVGGGTPLYVSRASRCASSPPDPHVRETQHAVAATHPHARPGPDTDDLVGTARSADDCHFSEAGIDEVARRWHAALAP